METVHEVQWTETWDIRLNKFLASTKSSDKISSNTYEDWGTNFSACLFPVSHLKLNRLHDRPPSWIIFSETWIHLLESMNLFTSKILVRSSDPDKQTSHVWQKMNLYNLLWISPGCKCTTHLYSFQGSNWRGVEPATSIFQPHYLS